VFDIPLTNYCILLPHATRDPPGLLARDEGKWEGKASGTPRPSGWRRVVLLETGGGQNYADGQYPPLSRSQLNQLHTLTAQFPKLRFNILLPSRYRCTK
jgi:hypothetical protein